MIPITVSLSLAFFIVISNGATILTIFSDGLLSNNISNYFIASLAVADFLIGFYSIPADAYYHKVLVHQNVNPVLYCDIFQLIHLTTGLASIWHLIAISVERYYCITTNFKYRRLMSKSRAALVILFIWLGSLLYAVLCLAGQKMTNTSNVNNCDFLRGPKVYTTLVMAIFFSGPSIVLFYYYGKLYRIASYNRQCVQSGSKRVTNEKLDSIILRLNCSEYASGSQLSTISENVHRMSKSNSNEKFHVALAAVTKEYRIAMLIGIVIVSFFACWYPAAAVYLYRLFCDTCPAQSRYFELIYPWLGWLNSAFNPIIYTLLSDDFRRALYSLMRCSNLRRK
ncbi:Alpha-1B adrenergic receptor [Halotydeus destructor]|nr:Alpha-1B adrenergic receptor [Halotydeus destructor]